MFSLFKFLSAFFVSYLLDMKLFDRIIHMMSEKYYI